ncbi:LAME_0F08240g1_1 [Lachancea meyersii CBS 8951]|uniref:Increased recombination centers protein 22 n=1 Tax=Lachancea meyersii CBS 8951 TaxID=1266667 RepID=A0A1G4JUI6_9SACH|nr:LAME_0F08240g1_1 [Lachancea meyersii CBS 8951]
MKLSYFQLGSLAIMKAIHVLGDDNVPNSSPEAITERANFSVVYETLERGPGSMASFLEFEDHDNVTLRYTFSNNENASVSVVAVGGALHDIYTNEIAANISAAALGPIPVAVNETVEFQQIINLVLKEGNYILSPDVYVERNEEETIRVIANPNLIRILPPAMSFFNPQFMFVQLILAALIAGFSYLTFFKTDKSSGARGQKSKKSKAGPASQNLDASWLPENHQKK